MTDSTLQCNELLFQGLTVGFFICLVIVLTIAYTFHRKYLIEQKLLKDQLDKANKAILVEKNLISYY